jgi:hypothetical protein
MLAQGLRSVLVALGIVAWSSTAAPSSMVTLFATDSLKNAGTAENTINISFPGFFPLPLQSASTQSKNDAAAEAGTQAFASFGTLKAEAHQSIDGSATDFTASYGEVKVTFEDSVTITGGSGTFNSSFLLDGMIDAIISSWVDDAGTAAPTMSEASYSAKVTVANGVFQWTGSASDTRPGGPASSIASDLEVGGAPVAGPVALPGLYTTPLLSYTSGVPFSIAAEIQVLVAGEDNDTSVLSSAADLFTSFIWAGITNLDGGVVTSESGTDWTVSSLPVSSVSVPEPSAALLVAPLVALLALAHRRRLTRGRSRRP